MSRRKGFPRLVKSVTPFTPDHPVARSIRSGSKWFDAWVAQMTTPYDKIMRKTGIAGDRLRQFSRGTDPKPDEIEALAVLWYVTPGGLLASIHQCRSIRERTGMFRSKQMPLAQWSAFQEQFSHLFTTTFHGDRGMAMFIESHGEGGLDTVLIPDQNASLIEALSPGGWSDCLDAGERKWSLLVGNADAWSDLGLPKPF